MLRLGLSYFVIMVVLDASTLILIAKAELLDLFLAHVSVHKNGINACKLLGRLRNLEKAW